MKYKLKESCGRATSGQATVIKTREVDNSVGALCYTPERGVPFEVGTKLQTFREGILRLETVVPEVRPYAKIVEFKKW